MLRAATGTPIRMIDLANIPLALAEPDPLTLANLTTKSLTRVVLIIQPPSSGLHRQICREGEILDNPRHG